MLAALLLFAPQTFDLQGAIPGTVAVFGPRTEILLVGSQGQEAHPVAAMGQAGKGRVVAFAHDAFVQFSNDPARAGALRDALRRARVMPGARVGCLTPESGTALKEAGFVPVPVTTERFGGVQAVVGPGYGKLGGLARWVQSGGVLVLGATPWGWRSLQSGRQLRDLPANELLREAGLAFAEGMTDGVRPFAAGDEVRADVALSALEKEGEASVGLVTAAIGALPNTHPFVRRAQRVGAEGAVAPTEARPVKRKDARARLALALAAEHRSLGLRYDFPGDVRAGAQRVQRTLAVPPNPGGWRMLEAYLAPGEEVTLRVPEEWVGSGLTLQVGVHTDELWHLDEWRRAPAVVVRTPITGAVTRLRSPYGGLVVLDLPEGWKGAGEVTVSGVVSAARWSRGETKREDWDRDLAAGAPWAEFEGKHVVLTVPAEAAAKVKDPERVVRFWDEVVELNAELDGRSPYARKERIVADRQISAGYMHSGYPIMTWLDVQDLVLDVDRLEKEGSWGHFHELGHNRQREWWTFEGTGEVTVNLYTLWVMERKVKLPVWSRLDDKVRARVREYWKEPNFEQWKSDPFLALAMYAQLIDGFGWPTLQKVLRDYEDDAPEQLPRTDDERRDQWMVRYSRATGRNLGPFFVKWGVPTSEAARRSVTDLPAWEDRLPD